MDLARSQLRPVKLPVSDQNYWVVRKNEIFGSFVQFCAHRVAKNYGYLQTEGRTSAQKDLL